MTVRLANVSDAEALNAIYAQYIATNITLEYELPSVAECARRIDSITRNYPYLVCEHSQAIVGYAYANVQNKRAAYSWNVESSIYVKQNMIAHGVGSLLYTKIIDLLKLQNIRNIFALITLPNDNSLRLHEKLGFTQVGFYPNAGFKNGKWHDVACYMKAIMPHTDDVKPFVSIASLQHHVIDECLRT